jgi:hypothetical protein
MSLNQPKLKPAQILLLLMLSSRLGQMITLNSLPR